jgi:hypothetical protein
VLGHKGEITVFGRLFRAAAAGGTGAKAIHVLSKTYSLEVSHPQHLSMMKRIAENFGEFFNEHEMAVQFLAQFANTVQTDHPQARREIEKYIRMSKGAYSRGLASDPQPQQELFRVAQERFGIDPSTIPGV